MFGNLMKRRWFWLLIALVALSLVTYKLLVATGVIITDGGKEFSLLDYQKALMCIPICLAIAFVALLRVKETYCVVKHEE